MWKLSNKKDVLVFYAIKIIFQNPLLFREPYKEKWFKSNEWCSHWYL